MRLRNWFRNDQPEGNGGDTPPQANLPHLRQVSRELLAAGEAAITKALSENSAEFLAATRQQGGQ